MRIAICSLVVAALVLTGCADDGSGDDVAGAPVDAGSDGSDGDSADPSTTTSGGGSPSDPGEGDEPGGGDPGDAEVTSPTTTVVVGPDPGTTDTTPPTTLPATIGMPEEGERLNEGGVPITLDETAALACANAEFARDSITFDNLEQAERDVAAAADRAEPSEQPDIAEAADLIRGALDTSDPLATVMSFLDICVEHGHQI